MENNITIKKPAKKKMGALQIVLLSALCLYTLILVMLFVWAILFSFKGEMEYATHVVQMGEGWKNVNPLGTFAFPKELTFESFIVAWDELVIPVGSVKYGVLDMYWNSILYSVGTAFTTTLVPCITAYLCAKFPYKFSKVISATVVVAMIIPIVGADASAIRVARLFNLYNSIPGMWIMGATFTGMYFLVFEAIFRSLPNDYAEAAEFDGASIWSVLFRIILPLVKNTFATVFLINFIGLWNNYATPMIYLRDYPTIAYGEYYAAFFTSHLKTQQIAIAMLVFIPMLVVFALFNGKLMGNLTMGGLKG